MKNRARSTQRVCVCTEGPGEQPSSGRGGEPRASWAGNKGQNEEGSACRAGREGRRLGARLCRWEARFKAQHLRK